ncbi:MAG: COX15/CtaA family protein, partial [Terriglobales bacterium]
MDQESRRQIAGWLAGCCVLVFLMVVVGGVTRLTHSGLSMVEWKPLV